MTVSFIPTIKFSTPVGKMATVIERSSKQIAVVSPPLLNHTMNAFAKLHQGNEVPVHRSAAGGLIG
jgi:hypothetical protein